MNNLDQKTTPTPMEEMHSATKEHVVTLTVNNGYPNMDLVAEFATAAVNASGPQHGQPVKSIRTKALDGKTELVATFRNLHCAHSMYEACEKMATKMPKEVSPKVIAETHALKVA